MDIDWSEIEKVLQAVTDYEIYRQMIVRLSKEVSSDSSECLVLKHYLDEVQFTDKDSNEPLSCIRSYWATNTFLAAEGEDSEILEEQLVTYMPYDSMCSGCKRKQAVIDERKRCKKMFGRAKTAISREGKLILGDFQRRDSSGELFNDFYNPLGLK